MKQKRDREEPCDVCGHYHDYLGGEPCGICGHKLEAAGAGVATPPSAKPPSAFPSEILPDFLFLGSYDHASRSEVLKTLGIGSILNTVPSCQVLYKNSFNYHTVSTSPPPFPECYAFLDDVQRVQGKVLVHCMSGLSRSAAVVIYFLMRRNGWRLSEAYQWVKDRRPQIAITADDAARLAAAELEVLGGNASGFQVPVGPQPVAGPAGQPQRPGAGPFGWPVFGTTTGALAGAGTGGAAAFSPGVAPRLDFGASPTQGAFVFGAPQQQQQQQQISEQEMME